jgi:DNA processing protein
MRQDLLFSFEQFRTSFSPSDYEKKCRDAQVTILSRDSDYYPNRLQTIADPPIVLFAKGNVETLTHSHPIAVVGTRKMTPYGKLMTGRICEGLLTFGCALVSGMAYGIDAVVHTTAIEHRGTTIIVLGCGVDIIAPPSNRSIYDAVIQKRCGAVISEMPLGMRPDKRLFPARNRIVSGMSEATLVTEGDEDSGAMITARCAADQGRDVFAVPGPVTLPGSHGPFLLIKNGAILTQSADDIAEELHFVKKAVSSDSDPNSLGMTQEERSIIASLRDGPRHIDELRAITHLSSSIVNATVTILEVGGIIRDSGGKVYVLR